MLKDPITILAQAAVGGPGGRKLLPGNFYELDDSPYVRILLKSGQVVLVDPPSLDPDFLEKSGYELRPGYSYEELKKETPKPEPKKRIIKLSTEPEKEPEPEKPYIMTNTKSANPTPKKKTPRKSSAPAYIPKEDSSPKEETLKKGDNEPQDFLLTPVYTDNETPEEDQ